MKNDPVNLVDPLGLQDADGEGDEGEVIVVTGNRTVDVVIRIGTVSYTVVVYGYQLVDFIGGLPGYAVKSAEYQKDKKVKVVLEYVGIDVKEPIPPNLIVPSYSQILQAHQDQIRHFYATQRGWLNNWKAKGKAAFDVLKDVFGGVVEK